VRGGTAGGGAARHPLGFARHAVFKRLVVDGHEPEEWKAHADIMPSGLADRRAS